MPRPISVGWLSDGARAAAAQESVAESNGRRKSTPLRRKVQRRARGRAVAWWRKRGHVGGVLNIHHLELFYHVARAGGISRAVKRIPYGIQQPAVSGQIAALEREVGVRLFERSPFKLTPAGVDLFDFVEPFFGGLGEMEAKLRERSAPVLRVGAAWL